MSYTDFVCQKPQLPARVSHDTTCSWADIYTPVRSNGSNLHKKNSDQFSTTQLAMAIGAPGSHQPNNEAANILENVWATIMTESATPASSTAASSEVGEEKPEAILQRLPSLGRWISMGAEEWDSSSSAARRSRRTPPAS